MWNDLGNGRCSMLDACSNPNNPEDVFKLLWTNFARHYNTNRAPIGKGKKIVFSNHHVTVALCLFWVWSERPKSSPCIFRDLFVCRKMIYTQNFLSAYSFKGRQPGMAKLPKRFPIWKDGRAWLCQPLKGHQFWTLEYSNLFASWCP